MQDILSYVPPQKEKPSPNISLIRVLKFPCAPHWRIIEPIQGGFKPYIQAKTAFEQTSTLTWRFKHGFPYLSICLNKKYSVTSG